MSPEGVATEPGILRMKEELRENRGEERNAGPPLGLVSAEEFRLMEERLKKSQRQLMEAQRVGHIGSWEWDIEDNSMTWTDELYRIFGLSPQRLNPTFEEVLAYIHPEDRRLVETTFHRALESHGPFSYEVRICRPDGTVRVISSRGEVIIDEGGNPLRLVAIEQDITERRQAEEERAKLEEQLRQSQKMEALGRLSGGIAHDFNNILTAIMGYGSLLQMELTGDKRLMTFSEEILSSAERAASLIRGLLAFGRKQVLNQRPVDINALIERVLGILSRVIGEDIEVRMRLTGEAATVMADEVQIEQVLLNLATNARDAMLEGGSFAIRTALVELDDAFNRVYGWGKPGGYVLVEVTDTGIGMDSATRERIFEPFFTTKEVGKGTGLGMSTVYGIVQQHNGHINIYSEPLKGTTVRIYLPALERREQEEELRQDPVPRRGSETILLAEDDDVLRRLMKELLEEFGYAVIEAADGIDAVQEFLEHRERVQLLIFDVIMPGKNGRDAYEEIRKIRPEVKILFMSGYAADIIDKAGIDDITRCFVSKPVSPFKLLRKIRELLDTTETG